MNGWYTAIVDIKNNECHGINNGVFRAILKLFQRYGIISTKHSEIIVLSLSIIIF